MATAIWRGGRCHARVDGGGTFAEQEKKGIHYTVPFDTEDEAKARAEQMLLAAFPHDCGSKNCPPWDRFGGPTG